MWERWEEKREEETGRKRQGKIDGGKEMERNRQGKETESKKEQGTVYRKFSTFTENAPSESHQTFL